MTMQASPGLVRAVNFLDRISLWSGRIVAWLIIPMVMSLVWEVVARYFFNAPTIWAYDMTYMLYGSFFMLGSAYTLLRGKHIRTDNLYGQWSPRRQGLVDTVCYLVFFFPPLIALLYVTWDYFWLSFMRGERVAEIHNAGDLHPSAAAGCRRVPAFVARRNDGRVAAGPVVDAAADDRRCLKSGSALYRWRSCSEPYSSAFRSHSH